MLNTVINFLFNNFIALQIAPQRDEIIFKQKVSDCVQHIILQKFTISMQFGHGVFGIFAMRQDGPVFLRQPVIGLGHFKDESFQYSTVNTGMFPVCIIHYTILTLPTATFFSASQTRLPQRGQPSDTETGALLVVPPADAERADDALDTPTNIIGIIISSSGGTIIIFFYSRQYKQASKFIKY